jgi:hypothetical protein
MENAGDPQLFRGQHQFGQGRDFATGLPLFARSMPHRREQLDLMAGDGPSARELFVSEFSRSSCGSPRWHSPCG